MPFMLEFRSSSVPLVTRANRSGTGNRVKIKTALLSTLALVAGLPLLLLALLLLQPSLLRAPLGMVAGWLTGLEIRIDGDLSLRPSPTPVLRAGRVTLRNPAFAEQPSLAELGLLELQLDLSSLLGDRIRLPRVVLTDASIHLARDQAWQGNWETGGGPDGATALPMVDHLSLSRIRLSYRQPGTPPLEARIETMEASIDPERGIQARLAMEVDGTPYRLEATSGSRGEGGFPLQAALQGADATLDIGGSLGWPLLETVATELRIRAQGKDLARSAALLAQPLPPLKEFAVDTRLHLSAGKLRLEKLRLQLEQTTVSGDLTLDSSTDPPQLRTTLAVDRIPEELLQRLLQWPRGGDGGQLPASLPDARFSLTLGRLDWHGQPVRDIRTNGRLAGGRLEAGLQGRPAFAGRVAARLQLTLDDASLPYRLTLSGRDLDLQRLSALLQPGEKRDLEGDIGQAGLELAGRLHPGPVTAGLTRLEATLRDARLDLPAGRGGRIRLRLQHAAARAGNRDARIAGEATGSVGGSPLTLAYRLGTLGGLAGRSAQPLWLKLRADPDTRLLAELEGSYRIVDSGLRYDGRMTARTDSLGQAGVPFGLRLPDLGAVTLETEIGGDPAGLTWSNTRMELDGGRLDGSGELHYAPLNYRLQATLQGRDTRLLRSLFGFAGAADRPLRGEVELSGGADRIDYRLSRLDIGSTRLSGSGAMLHGPNGNRFEGDLLMEQLQLDDFIPDEGSQAPPPAPATGADTRLIPALAIDTRWLQRLTLDLEVDVRHLLEGKDDLGEYRIHASVADGTLSTRVGIRSKYIPSIDLTASVSNRGDSSEIDFRTEVKDLDYGALFRIFDISDRIEGRLDLELRFRGGGRDLRSLLAAGEGEVVLSGGEGRLDFEALRLWGGSPVDLLLPSALLGKRTDRLECLAARYRLTPGRWVSDGIVLNLEKVLISGAVELKLPSERLSGVFRPQPKESRLVTMDTPISLSGTLARPVAGPAATDALVAVGKLAVGISNPAALVVLFGSLGNTVENPCEAVLSGTLKMPRDLRQELEETTTRPLRGLVEGVEKGTAPPPAPAGPLVPAGQ
ncbi:MAG TPA: AsmA family protein [Sedimenticola thiotaurini]|uniref:AsmA family protein n=1 Tax=Sedimenticola thiotaurini TaxID=1543721 RepID=A0A831RN48_9GAMM|nr:AsmA family protein [Sedimenticola thiotaurini]